MWHHMIIERCFCSMKVKSGMIVWNTTLQVVRRALEALNRNTLLRICNDKFSFITWLYLVQRWSLHLHEKGIVTESQKTFDKECCRSSCVNSVYVMTSTLYSFNSTSLTRICCLNVHSSLDLIAECCLSYLINTTVKSHLRDFTLSSLISKNKHSLMTDTLVCFKLHCVSALTTDSGD